MKTFRLFLICLILSACISGEKDEISIADAMASISKRANPIQSFQIAPEKDTVVTGVKGTSIFIKSNSLVFENGEPVKSEISLSLKEVYTVSEMILNGLTTTSKGELLETSGMINLTATSEGKPLKLKAEFPLKIRFKNISNAPSMRTYIGSRDSALIDWQLDAENVYDTTKFKKEIEALYELPYGVDSVGIFEETYGVIGSDTILLEREMKYDDSNLDYAKASLLFYELHTTKLNWINCDYFIGSIDTVDVLVRISDESKALTFILFKEYNSIMAFSEYKSGEYVFRNIPRGSLVTLLSIYTLDSNYFLAMKDVTLKRDKQQIILDFNKFNLEDFEGQINSLND